LSKRENLKIFKSKSKMFSLSFFYLQTGSNQKLYWMEVSLPRRKKEQKMKKNKFWNTYFQSNGENHFHFLNCSWYKWRGKWR
jgi:hypothetical protein